MKRKVKFFRKHLDFIFSNISWIIAILILVTLVYFRSDIKSIVLFVFDGLSQIQNDIITGLIIAFLSAVPCFIETRLKQIHSYILYIKSSLYITLLNNYEEKKSGFSHFIVPRLIKLFYSYKRLVFNEQQQITNQILDTLLYPSHDRKNVFWIIGDTYSGKTSSVLNLLTDLITNEKYYNLFQRVDNHIEYLDCGRDDCDLSTFFHSYKIGKYKKSMVVIDNVHKIIHDRGIQEINAIVHRLNAFSLIIVMRPLQDFVMQKEIIDTLENTIETEGYCFNLPYQINQYDNKTKDFWDFIETHELGDYSQQSIILFHFMKIYLKSEKDLKTVNLIADFLNNKNESELSMLLRHIIVASMFTGSFNTKLIFKEMRGSVSQIKIKSMLDDLYDIGFLNIYPNENSSYYFFHEELAKFYFENTYSLQRNEYSSIFKKYYDYYQNKQNEYLSYLYSILTDNHIDNVKLFEQVAINVNYRTLLGELDYLTKVSFDLSLKYHKERGTLYDRSGELLNAKIEYMKYYEQSDVVSQIDAFYKVVQVDHSFYGLNSNQIQHHKQSLNVYDRLLAQYWDIHMNMHYGKFKIDEMQELLTHLNKVAHTLINQKPYDSLHLIRRCFFDFFRLYYISGITDYSRLNILNYRNIDNILKKELEEYQAYYNKFIYGHYLLYEVLFKLGIWGIQITKDEYKLLFINAPHVKYEKLLHIDGVIDTALDFYKKSYDYLYNIGDKTYYFVNCRYMEVLVAAGEYDKPKNYYLEFQNYAKSENVVYYEACAEIYLFKVEFSYLLSENGLTTQNSIYMQKLFEAENHLKLAKKYFKEADTNPENIYAKTMINLYETLFYFYKEQRNKDYLKKHLKAIKAQCELRKYNRELKIIRFIEENNYKLQPITLKKIVLYYPFVAQ